MANWIEISEERLAANYLALRSAAGKETAVMAVIKANGYGHGAATCAPILVETGAEWLGVTNAQEGAAVRRALSGAPASILVMSGFLPEDVRVLVQFGLTPVVWTREQVRWLAEFGSCAPDREIGVHVEVDTGMSRQGCRPGLELEELVSDLERMPGLRLDGIFTHFCSSEAADSGLTLEQQKLFTEAVAQIAARGLRPAWVHAGNTSSVDNPAGDAGWLTGLAQTVGARAMVRTGLGLYGYCLAIEPEGRPQVAPALLPVMTWKARILSVRELCAGAAIGYNATFVARQPMRIALLPVGYADGLRRELSSGNFSELKAGGWVMIAGQRAPILGRISMNLTVLDVTGIARVQAGDEAVVLGDGITAEDHARLAGTIAYEIVCGVHPCG